MRHVRLFHFDFEAVPSRDHALALADCQRLLNRATRRRPRDCGTGLVWIADARRTGGSINLPQALTELRGAFELSDHPDYRRDAEALGA